MPAFLPGRGPSFCGKVVPYLSDLRNLILVNHAFCVAAIEKILIKLDQRRFLIYESVRSQRILFVPNCRVQILIQYGDLYLRGIRTPGPVIITPSLSLGQLQIYPGIDCHFSGNPVSIRCRIEIIGTLINSFLVRIVIYIRSSVILQEIVRSVDREVSGICGSILLCIRTKSCDRNFSSICAIIVECLPVPVPVILLCRTDIRV